MRLGNAVLPSLSLPQERSASIIHCRAGSLGSQRSQHSQPRCWSALCHLLVPARILVKLWRSSGDVAGGRGLCQACRCRAVIALLATRELPVTV